MDVQGQVRPPAERPGGTFPSRSKAASASHAARAVMAVARGAHDAARAHCSPAAHPVSPPRALYQLQLVRAEEARKYIPKDFDLVEWFG